MPNSPIRQKPRCPSCENEMSYRKSAKGFVCKNRECKNFWNKGEGPVYDRNGREIKIQKGYKRWTESE